MIVLDASAAVEVLLGSEAGRRVLDRLEPHSEVHVPEHFHIEAISALRRYALRGELGELRAAGAMSMLRELRAVCHPVIDLRETIWELREQLSAYDAAYLALARRLDLSLLTTDAGLAAAARAEGRLTEIDSPPLAATDVLRLQRCVAVGQVAIFPTDTVYGLGCDPDSESAVRRLYELKGRPPDRPAAIMFFAVDAALRALPELGPRTRAALPKLLPGPLTLLLPNPGHRYPLACSPALVCGAAPVHSSAPVRSSTPLRSSARAGASAPRPNVSLLAPAFDTLGLRVPLLPDRVAALSAFDGPLLQSSANRSGEPDCRRLSDVPPEIRAGADLVLDGGELPGTASTVLDLSDYERTGSWRIVRVGPVGEAEIERALE